ESGSMVARARRPHSGPSSSPCPLRAMSVFRSIVSGGTYFFTVDLDNCRSGLLVERAYDLGAAIRHVRDTHPFDVIAWVLLPDHLHALWTLPEDDAAVGLRWSLVKARFAGPASDPWQRGYRERRVRGEPAVQ